MVSIWVFTYKTCHKKAACDGHDDAQCTGAGANQAEALAKLTQLLLFAIIARNSDTEAHEKPRFPL